MAFSTKAEEKYVVSRNTIKAFEIISRQLKRQDMFRLKYQWEILLMNMQDDLCEFDVSDPNCQHIMQYCVNNDIIIDENQWNECFSILSEHVTLDNPKLQPIVDTGNTIIYKRFKKVINIDLYLRLKDISREDILQMLLNYEMIGARKLQSIPDYRSNCDIMQLMDKIGKFDLECYASPLSQSGLSNAFCSMFPIDKEFGAVGNFHRMSLSQLSTYNSFLINPPNTIPAMKNAMIIANELVNNAQDNNTALTLLILLPRNLQVETTSLPNPKFIEENHQLPRLTPGYKKLSSIDQFTFYDYNGIQKKIKDKPCLIPYLYEI